MMKATAIIFLSFLPFSLYAQESTASIRAGGGHVFVGTDFINTASLDRTLRRYHLPEFGGNTNLLVFGGGGGAFINRFFYGGEGAGQVGISASNDYYKSKIYGGHGLVQVGYALVQNANLALYPTFGAGGGGTMMRLDEGSSFSDDVDGLLLLPDAKLHAGYMLLKLGLNSDFLLDPIVVQPAGFSWASPQDISWLRLFPGGNMMITLFRNWVNLIPRDSMLD